MRKAKKKAKKTRAKKTTTRAKKKKSVTAKAPKLTETQIEVLDVARAAVDRNTVVRKVKTLPACIERSAKVLERYGYLERRDVKGQRVYKRTKAGTQALRAGA